MHHSLLLPTILIAVTLWGVFPPSTRSEPLATVQTPVRNNALLAVLEFDARGNVSRDEAGTLTDRLRAHLIQAGSFQVLEREQMHAILREQGFQQSQQSCAEQDCSVDLGKLLGVKYLLSGSVSQVSGLYVLSARLLDVELGVIVREEYVDCDCDLRAVLTLSTRSLADKLLQVSPGPSQNSTLDSQSIPRLSTLTLAGSGWAGDQDGKALDASFREPSGLGLLPDGSLVIADAGNHRLRHFDLHQVNTLAGASWNLLAGEVLAAYGDGPANQARFHSPGAVAVSRQGIVYIADTNNHRIRKLWPDGNVTSWVGTGEAGFDDGNAAVARFNRPQGLAWGSDGYLYVADTDNHRIRKISPLGIVSTLAGGPAGFADGTASQAAFNFPTGLGFAPDGHLLVADTFNHRIRSIDLTGQVTTLAGSGDAAFADGKALEARLNAPRALAIDPKGRVFIADTGNHRIRILHQGRLETLVGTGHAGFADGNPAVGQFNQPKGLILQGQRLLVADSGNQRIRAIDLAESQFK